MKIQDAVVDHRITVFISATVTHSNDFHPLWWVCASTAILLYAIAKHNACRGVRLLQSNFERGKFRSASLRSTKWNTISVGLAHRASKQMKTKRAISLFEYSAPFIAHSATINVQGVCSADFLFWIPWDLYIAHKYLLSLCCTVSYERTFLN